MPIARLAPPTARVREACRRSSGQLSVGLRHERGPALVTRRHDPDARVPEGVQQAEERLARHGEGVADAGRPQGIGDEPPHGPGPTRARPRLAASVSGAAAAARRLGLGGPALAVVGLGVGPARPRPASGRRPSAVGRVGLRLVAAGACGSRGRVGLGRIGRRLRRRPVAGSVGGDGSGSVMVGRPRAAGQYASGKATADRISAKTITAATTSITACVRRVIRASAAYR